MFELVKICGYKLKNAKKSLLSDIKPFKKSDSNDSYAYADEFIKIKHVTAHGDDESLSELVDCRGVTPNQVSEIDVIDIGNGNTEIVINTDEKTEALLVKNKNGQTAEIKKILKTNPRYGLKNQNRSMHLNKPLTIIPPLNPEDREAAERIIFKSSWRELVKLTNLYEAGLIEIGTVKRLIKGEVNVDTASVLDQVYQWIDGNDPVAGIFHVETGEKISLYKAAKQGIIMRGVAVALLEAQAAVGNIIDPVTGRKMSVKVSFSPEFD